MNKSKESKLIPNVDPEYNSSKDELGQSIGLKKNIPNIIRTIRKSIKEKLPYINLNELIPLENQIRKSYFKGDTQDIPFKENENIKLKPKSLNPTYEKYIKNIKLTLKSRTKLISFENEEIKLEKDSDDKFNNIGDNKNIFSDKQSIINQNPSLVNHARLENEKTNFVDNDFLAELQRQLAKFTNEEYGGGKDPKIKKGPFEENKFNVYRKVGTLHKGKSPYSPKKLMMENIFWTKEKMQAIRAKFQLAKIKIEEKTKEDFDILDNHIEMQNENEILDILLDEQFMNFYKLEIQRRDVLEKILINCKSHILKKILEYDLYKFKKGFVFEYITQLIEFYEIDYKFNDDEKSIEIFETIIDLNLYDEQLDILLGYFLNFFSLNDIFIKLVKKSKNFDALLVIHHKFQDFDLIKFSDSEIIINEVLAICLKYSFQDFAIFIVNNKEDKVDYDKLLITSVRFNSMILLSYLWHAKYEINKTNKAVKYTKLQLLKESSKSLNKNKFNKQYQSSVSSDLDGIDIDIYKEINLLKIIEKFHDEKKKNFISEIILNWDHLDREPKLINLLFELKCFNEINLLITSKRRFISAFTRENCIEVIQNFQHDLILFFLRKDDYLSILEDQNMQKFIVKNYLISGKNIYCGSEMLAMIDKKSWYSELTNDLCSNIEKVLKKRYILTCHSPVLTSILLCEFLNRIKDISQKYFTKCQSIILSLEKLCCNIQEANTDEKYLNYIMSQKDIRNRSIYKIAADNKFFEILQSPELGSLIKKMWEGNNIGEDIFQSSCLFIYLTNIHLKSPFLINDNRDPEKAYSFQYESWKNSCSLRFYPEMLSTVFLIIIYNFYIFFLVDENLVEERFVNLPFKIQFLLYVYVGWTLSIALNIVNLFIFRLLTRRNFRFDMLTYIEFLTFIFAFSLIIDTDYYPIFEQLTLVEQFGLSAKFLIRAILLSLNDILVWLRIFTIMLTFKGIGPLISMMYLLFTKMLNYIILYFFYLITCCTIFMSLFYRISNQFSEYSVGLTTLFGGFINNLNVFDFEQENFFGAIFIMIYVTLSGLILINFLIAILTNIYRRFSISVDSNYRSILISYHKRYKWDAKYGFLVFLTTPFSILNSLALPIIFIYSKFSNKKFEIWRSLCRFCRLRKGKTLHNNRNNIHNRKKFFIENLSIQNKKKNIYSSSNIKSLGDAVAKIYFSIFYLPFILCSYFFYLNFMVPLCYIKGIFELFYYEFLSRGIKNFKHNFISKCWNFATWLFIGLPFLLLIVYNDIYFVLRSAFKFRDNEYKHEDIRIKKYLKSTDIITFLIFIHQRSKEEANDLHNLFMDYLKFEKEKLIEVDNNLKEKDIYKKKISSKKKKIMQQRSILLKKKINSRGANISSNSFKESELQKFNNYYRKNISNDNKTNPNKIKDIASSYVKKNIIIIEIMENFLIDDGTDNCVVDIEKMQMLLPNTLNVDKAYLRRLLYTNVNYINKALKKLKTTHENAIRYQLTNRIASAVNTINIRIDNSAKIKASKKNKNYQIHMDLVCSDIEEEKENIKFCKEDIKNILEIMRDDLHDQINQFKNNYVQIIEEDKE